MNEVTCDKQKGKGRLQKNVTDQFYFLSSKHLGENFHI